VFESADPDLLCLIHNVLIFRLVLHKFCQSLEGDQNEIEVETDIKEVKCEEKTTNTVESDNTHKIEHENISVSIRFLRFIWTHTLLC
jgi:hypothetical protein